MKWIGQHIWDFISRFRSTVYIENLETSSEENVLVVDSDGKVTKNTTLGGSDLTITNAGDNRVVTSTGGTGLDAEAGFTYNNSTDEVYLTSSSAGKPDFYLYNTNTSKVQSSSLVFRKDGADSEDEEQLGKILFMGDDNGGALTSFAQIIATIEDVVHTAEAGGLRFNVAEYDGTMTTGLFIDGDTDQDGEIDVTIGAGAGSTTTVAGNLTVTSDLTVSGTTTTINTTNLNVEDKNITLNYNNSSDTSGTADGAGITIQDAVDASNNASLTWTAADDTFEFSHAVEINNGASGGTSALIIDNDDVDQVALSIDAANTTAHVVNIDAAAATTGNIVDIRGDALTNGNPILVTHNDGLTTDVNRSENGLIRLDYNKSGDVGGSQTVSQNGINLTMNDAATNNAGTMNMTGIKMVVDSASTNGTVSNTGIDITVTDSDTNNGIELTCEDGAGADITLKSSADAQDYFTIDTKEDGETTFTTVENGSGGTAHMNFNADGDINLNPSMSAGNDGSINMLMVDSNYNKGIKGTLDSVSNECFVFHGVAGDYTALRLYAGGGDTNALNDYLEITCWQNGETVINTVDADAALAKIEISPNGDLELKPSTGDTTFSSTTSAKPLVTLKSTNTTKTTSAELKFAKDAANVEDEEVLGQVSFYGDNYGGAQTKHADITVKVNDINAGNYSLAEMNLNILNHNQGGTYYSTGLKLFGNFSNTSNVDVNIASGAGSMTTIAGNLDIDGDTITSAGDLTIDTVGDISLDAHTAKDIFFKENGTERIQWHLDSTPTMEVTGNFDIDGGADITLDANLDIILNAAGNDIIVDADSFSMSSSTGFKPEINLTATGTAPTKAATFNFIKDAADTEDGEFLGIVNFIGEDEGNNVHNFAKIIGSIAESDEGAEGGKLDFQVANHDGGLESGLTITDGDADGELDVTIASGAASTTTVAGNLNITTGVTGSKAGQIIHYKPTSYMFYIFYMNTQNNWYSPNTYSTSTGSTNAIGSHANLSYTNAAFHNGYIAPRACKVKKIMLTAYFFSSYFGASDDVAVEWGLLKWTPVDDSTSSVAVTDMAMTDHNGNYRELKMVHKTFTVTDNADSNLAAGDVFNFFGRVTNTGTGGSTVRCLWRGDVTYEIELTE